MVAGKRAGTSAAPMFAPASAGRSACATTGTALVTGHPAAGTYIHTTCWHHRSVDPAVVAPLAAVCVCSLRPTIWGESQRLHATHAVLCITQARVAAAPGAACRVAPTSSAPRARCTAAERAGITSLRTCAPTLRRCCRVVGLLYGAASMPRAPKRQQHSPGRPAPTRTSPPLHFHTPRPSHSLSERITAFSSSSQLLFTVPCSRRKLSPAWTLPRSTPAAPSPRR